ncbi:FAD-dependent oxidoreductase [Shimia abyssi]|uniref:FAD dependent oxidoreductase n=1 Tax=Shimia abyssi TaxID=1662395 RepID=A0A2P8FKS6_9RHOB|nr:FAD-dependent oxidoreductase [Shimia abyssi]PSL22299.1 FAD dependent oxidoreductase [Shimia abyssi]
MSEVWAADVVVIGGGTAGFGAAVAAGRLGLDVILVEGSAKVGGVMAFCPGMPWGAAYPNDAIIGGLMEELTERLGAMDPPAAEKRPCTLANFGPEIQYDHDLATVAMFQMLEEAGVRVHVNTTAVAPVMQGNRIIAVDVFDRHGRHQIEAKFVLDCSGDGDISAKAGVPYSVGDAEGNVMGVTLSFQMVGAEWEQVFAEDDPYFTRFAAKGIDEGRLHPDLAQLYLMRGFHKDTVFCNSVVIRNVDGTDSRAVAAATQEGRRRCMELAAFLRADVPGFEAARMVYLGPTVGVRETRKLEGVYQVTGDDLRAGRKFADGIVCCDNPIDDVMRGEEMTHDAIVGQGDYYRIPFRSLVPREVENLMFAGRIICADPEAFASVRGMPQCMAMGQAVGTAAAMAFAEEIDVQDISTSALVALLQAQGVNGLGEDAL